MKIEINSASEEKLLRECDEIFVGFGKLKELQAKLHVQARCLKVETLIILIKGEN